MIFVIKYDRGPDYWHSKGVRVEAPTESIAMAKLLMMLPTAKITSAEPVGVEE